MVPGGNPRRVLEAVRRDYPVVLHGVSLSIGSTDPLRRALPRRAGGARARHRARLDLGSPVLGLGARRLCARSAAGAVHRGGAGAHRRGACRRCRSASGAASCSRTRRPTCSFAGAEMTEWQFLAELARRADCGILLDVNNVFVSAHNHGFDPRAYLRALPPERVGQIHLAGHSVEGELLIDTHDDFVREEVWQLYRDAIARFGARADHDRVGRAGAGVRDARGRAGAGARVGSRPRAAREKASAMPPEAGAPPTSNRCARSTTRCWRRSRSGTAARRFPTRRR